MKRIEYFSVIAIFMAALSGCATHPGPMEGYGNPDDDVYGSPWRMEYPQLLRAMEDVLARMKTDPRFTTMYKAACERAIAEKRKSKLPTIAVRPIENNSGDGRTDSEATGQIYRNLLAHIGKMMRPDGKSQMFELIDYARRSQMKGTVVTAADDGEAPNNIQYIGNYTSADFIMTGELKRSETVDKGRIVYHHFLNLEMTDTSTGTVFWSDTATPTVKFHVH